jgi:regulator of protease activity HflC (stomatin/prohibitin superfamily)
MRADSVRIEDIAYSSAYERAIEAKQIAQQEALAEKNKTEKVKQISEQKLISAKAEAEAMRIQTQALSQSKSLIEYERVQVEKLQAERWNGVLPQAIYTGTPLPILNAK